MTDQMSLLEPPVHRNDPLSSREAADRVRPSLAGQFRKVFGAVLLGGPEPMSNRDIQIAVCGGHNPGHPLWNKIPTRCRTLERKGLIELVLDADGEPVLTEHWSGGRYLTWRVAP